ncbi:MAG: YdcF family protein [Alphaproteobacteria bacterium]|nr:YdcF family protein [Alphaproteobacteria bacterium]
MFVASKIGWIAGNPATLLLLVLAVGAILLWTRWRRGGRVLVTAGTALFVALAVLPIGPALLAVLEDRFPNPEPLPARIDGIIVLGGAILVQTSVERDAAQLNGYADRFTAFLALARRFPDAHLVFSGGSASILDPTLIESAVAAPLLESLGLTLGRVTFEDESRNTCENAAATRALVQPQPGETWVVVTSGFHMPRAVACFRAVGWDIIPYPTDYQTGGLAHQGVGLDPVGGLKSLNLAVHELLGLIVYRLAGMTEDLWPGPNG